MQNLTLENDFILYLLDVLLNSIFEIGVSEK